MELTKDEKKVLKFLVDRELKTILEEEKELGHLRPQVGFLALEEKYEILLEKLKKKLE
jgi:hypothetical protein